MPPARTGIKHVRHIENLALCGECGPGVRFAVGSGAQTDCGVCKVRRQKAIESHRARRELAARMKALRVS